LRVLITGIDGFTGRHLKNYLSDYDVFGTSLLKSGDNVYKCDVTDEESVKQVLEKVKPDVIIHLAALSFVGYGNINDFYKVNVIGSENILKNAKNAKVIVASSATVYGNQSKEVLDEGMCLNPNNHYALSKYSAEQIAKNYFDKLNVIIVRPFNYTGVWQEEHFLVPKIVKHFKERKKEIKLGNLDVIREFNDVSFVCEAYKRLINSDVHGEILNIASSRGIKLLDIVKYMEDIAGYKIKIIQDEKFIRKNEIKKLIGSNKKLFSLIGEISQPDFYQTLKVMYETSG